MIPSQEAIAERALELWAKAGRPADRAQEFWMLAEEDLEGRQFQEEHARATPVSKEALSEVHSLT